MSQKSDTQFVRNSDKRQTGNSSDISKDSFNDGLKGLGQTSDLLPKTTTVHCRKEVKVKETSNLSDVSKDLFNNGLKGRIQTNDLLPNTTTAHCKKDTKVKASGSPDNKSNQNHALEDTVIAEETDTSKSSYFDESSDASWLKFMKNNNGFQTSTTESSSAFTSDNKSNSICTAESQVAQISGCLGKGRLSQGISKTTTTSVKDAKSRLISEGDLTKNAPKATINPMTEITKLQPKIVMLEDVRSGMEFEKILPQRKSYRSKTENVRYKGYILKSTQSQSSENCARKQHQSTVVEGQELAPTTTSHFDLSKNLPKDNKSKPQLTCTSSCSAESQDTELHQFSVDLSMKSSQKRKIHPKLTQSAKKCKNSTSSENTGESHFIVETSQSKSIDEMHTSGTLNTSAPQYLSNDSLTDEEKEVVKQTRGAGKDWIVVESFENPKVAEDKMASLKDFHREYTHTSSTGKKINFYCKLKPCPAKYQLFYNTNITTILKYSDHDHDHLNAAVAQPQLLKRIPEASKSKIKELRSMKLKPKAIISTMRKNHPELPVPTLKQVYGLNSRQSKNKTKISLGEMEQWLTDRSAIPDNIHTVFVVQYEIDYKSPHFRFFLSTRNLLTQTFNSKIVHTDTTYKLNYEGFPMLVVGVTDLDRHFHPSGIALCTDEKTEDFEFIFRSLSSGVEKEVGKCFIPTTLVADAAEAIHNGFTTVFGMLLIIMCWAHLKRAVRKRYRTKHNIEAILSDLDVLQLSPSIDSFHIALNLFFEKWNDEEEFIAYFKEQWIDHNGNWFEAVQKLTPKTDNALEGTNKWIKDSHTMRERLPLVQFLDSMVKMVNDWSCEYIQDKVFIFEPTIDLPLWTKSYHWVKLEKRVLVVHNASSHENDNLYIFKIPATGHDRVVESDLSQCKSLEEFQKNAFAFYIVEMPSNDWRKGTCTCPSFYKLFICKHLIGMAMRYKLVEPPLAAKDVPVGKKRGRGRPRKAKHALLVD